MKLQEESYRWSIKHLFKESDTDLFPKPFELNVVKDCEEEILKFCINLDITNYKWKAARRFIVPKDNTSYRVATQLDIFDSILLGAIVYEFGKLIENNRIPETSDTVFSYRFNPTEEGTLYGNKKAWNKFWSSCRVKAENYEYVVMCDIADFYNQIYHHTIENQLLVCGFDKPLIKVLKNLITSITQRNSRGIPVGPHAFHIFAEMSLTPIDKSLSLKNIPFKRYVDDIVLFCRSEKEARIRINQIAEILDKQQRLILQNHKTIIFNKESFIAKCSAMLTEEAGAQTEKELIDIINSYAEGDAYTKIRITDISNPDLLRLPKGDIVSLLDSYLRPEKPNYEKIRWLYRRLSQIGLGHAVDFSIQNFEKLIPALNDVCLYISSCADNYNSNWQSVAEVVLTLMQDEIITSNEFYKISLLSLFVYNPNLNHFSNLIEMYSNSSSSVKREILLASLNYDSSSWITELKEQFGMADDWTKRAYLIAATKMPEDEKEFFFKGVKINLTPNDIIEHTILKWNSI
ncbi:RNA-directed DNA polymerase [Hymenobacter sp. BRD128]|uniref:RNA-directed DNA polymerase n=1 Tax=Hymenobacter sp. BRD128 TaxID=2675878 RepID=UPI001567483A|nr:RNA-directed DNA polymerase [Hymenobacter sp. BRD128]QKG55743.1 RNA-directed DNA polymerase [Hymenobacter sp. BRD128]